MVNAHEFICDQDRALMVHCVNVNSSVPKTRVISYLTAIGFLICFSFAFGVHLFPELELWLVVPCEIAIFCWGSYVLYQFMDGACYSIKIDCLHQVLVRIFQLGGLRLSRRVFSFESVEGFRYALKEKVQASDYGEDIHWYIPIIYITQRGKTCKPVETKLCRSPSMNSPDDQARQHTETFKTFLEQLILFRPPSPMDLLRAPRFHAFSEQWTRNAAWGTNFWRRWNYALVLTIVVYFCTIILTSCS